jgi:hypothetical protein
MALGWKKAVLSDADIGPEARTKSRVMTFLVCLAGCHPSWHALKRCPGQVWSLKPFVEVCINESHHCSAGWLSHLKFC